jgi:hypothetical protein
MICMARTKPFAPRTMVRPALPQRRLLRRKPCPERANLIVRKQRTKKVKK